MKIYAFQGFRYSSEAGEGAELQAPPFDQIDATLQAELHRGSPYQFAHLTRPIPGGEGDPYRHAAALHQEWVGRGVVTRDPEPALYPYVVEIAGGARRLGLACLIAVDESAAGDLHPHEATVEKPLADRLSLLRAMRVDLEPVFLLSQDRGELDELLLEDVTRGPELDRHLDGYGNRHLLFRVDDVARIDAYRQALAPYATAIADGHHRSKVAKRFAQETSAIAGSPAASKLAVLTSLTSQELRIDPIHRALGRRLETASLSRLLLSREPLSIGNGTELAAAVARAPQPALGVRLGGHEAELWRLDSERAPTDTPRGGAGLAVVLLHHQLLAAAGLDRSSASDGTILYRSDPDELHEMVLCGEAQAGFWLPPMEPAAFAAAIAGGDLLPPKSTRFLPKLVSGLVWVGHDAQLV